MALSKKKTKRELAQEAAKKAKDVKAQKKFTRTFKKVASPRLRTRVEAEEALAKQQKQRQKTPKVVSARKVKESADRRKAALLKKAQVENTKRNIEDLTKRLKAKAAQERAKQQKKKRKKR